MLEEGVLEQRGHDRRADIGIRETGRASALEGAVALELREPRWYRRWTDGDLLEDRRHDPGARQTAVALAQQWSDGVALISELDDQWELIAPGLKESDHECRERLTRLALERIVFRESLDRYVASDRDHAVEID